MDRAESTVADTPRAGAASFIPVLVLLNVAGLLLGGIFGVLSVRQLQRTSRTTEVLTRHAEAAFAAERLMALTERRGRASRSYLLTKEPRYLDELRATQHDFAAMVERVRSRTTENESVRLIERLDEIGLAHGASVERAIRLREASQSTDGVSSILEREVQPLRDELTEVVDALLDVKQAGFERARQSAVETGTNAYRLLLAAAVIAGGLAAILVLTLVRVARRLAASRQALRATLRRLEEKNQDLDAFAGRVAHDLRNIISPLGMIAAMLRSAASANEALRTSAERIDRVARRADVWSQAMLAFARSGHGVDPRSRASLKAAVHDVLETLSQQRSQVGAEVDVSVEDLEVACPPPLLAVVVLNIVGNAFKFLEGCSRRKVVICSRRDGPLGELVVDDTGPGIAPEHQQKIFDPFYRADGGAAQGSGIGLATARRIVEAHRGHILVEAAVGEGSRFRVRLPLARAGTEKAVAHVVARTPRQQPDSATTGPI